MHYVPDSARDFLPSAADDSGNERPAGFHAQSAPVYLLTFAVGGLLAGDLLAGWIDDPAWRAWQTVGGFRLALLAAVLGGSRILYQTLENLFEGRIGADLALTIAALAAIVLGEHTTAALVVFVALVGESIEGYTVSRARQAVASVFQLIPPVTRLLRDDQELEVPSAEVEPGDKVLVRSGERVPVDGFVVAGESSVDESAVTGESIPREVQPGAVVYAGTLNQLGGLTVETRRRGEATTVGQIAGLVAEAAARKTPQERTADRLARLFLPIVLTVAGLTLIGWRIAEGEWAAGWLPALAVLVVACPCPLILATPTAVMATMARLARAGVVVKGSAALERLAGIDTLAFDKTGTLTRGEIAVTRVQPAGELPETELLRIAGIAERHSEHPLARAIGRAAEAAGLVLPPPPVFTAHPGAGVVARVPYSVCGPEVLQLAGVVENADAVAGGDAGGEVPACRVLVGSRRFVEQQEVSFGEQSLRQLEEMEADGQTVLVVAVADRLAGLIAVSDRPRENAGDTLAALRAAGIERFAVLTGDQRAPALAIAGSLGLKDCVHAGLLPEDKSAWIAREVAAGHRVAMVGDGVNDAPALAAATAGIALGGVGSDLAAEAGDLVLMGDPLQPLPLLVRLSRQMVANIRQSIVVFAFGVNGLGIVLSAAGFLSPVAGAIFHEFASLAVMLNAMRLLWAERPGQAASGQSSEGLLEHVERLTAALSPSRLVYRVMVHWRKLLRLTCAAAACVWLVSGVVRIGEDEQALVTRLGRLEAELSPGVHFRWPYPFEQVIRNRTGELRSVQIGFRQAVFPDGAGADAADDELTRMPVIEWTTEHTSPGFEAVPAEALVMTGDEVPVELTADVQYRISSLYDFHFGSRDPETTVRALAEAAVRQVAAGMSLEHLLTDRRAEIEQRCLWLIGSQAAEFGLGIEIEQVYLLDVHPPQPVVPAYRDVADALEEREQRINEAEAWRTSRLLSAVGERALARLEQAGREQSAAAQPVREQSVREEEPDNAPAGRRSEEPRATMPGHTEAPDAERVAEREMAGERLVDHKRTEGADWQLTDRLWQILVAGGAAVEGESVLSGETASELAAARQKAVEIREQAGGRAVRFRRLQATWQAAPALTGTELYWRSMSETLAGRPMTILDPRATGRRHLLLSEPEFPGASRLLEQGALPHEPSLDGAESSGPPRFSQPPAGTVPGSGSGRSGAP